MPIIDERLTTYLDSQYPNLNEHLSRIQKEAIENYVPIVKPGTINYLRMMINLKKPKKVLEVGTAVGFSALVMAYTNPDLEITTIENYAPRIPIARANFEEAGFSNRITLIEGDAMDVLTTLNTAEYDLIFMDAAKGQYINYWPEMKRVLAGDGVIITDNCLQDGDIIESRFAVERRDRTIHKRMRAYLYEICHDECFSSSILPIGDGVATSVRIK